MAQYGEYDTSAFSVNGPPCSYATLGHYNLQSGSGPPVPAATASTSGHYIVPAYTAPPYDTLTHNSAPSCSGFFNIDSAYKTQGGNCNQKYLTSQCNQSL